MTPRWRPHHHLASGRRGRACRAQDPSGTTEVGRISIKAARPSLSQSAIDYPNELLKAVQRAGPQRVGGLAVGQQSVCRIIVVEFAICPLYLLHYPIPRCVQIRDGQ